MPAALAPCENDLLNGTRFALARRDEEVADFLDQTWIDGWLRESFLQYASQVENRSNRPYNKRCVALSIRRTG